MTPRERAINYSHSLIVKARLSKSDELIDDVEKMIAHAIEEEREACAKIAEETAERIGAGFLGYGTARGVARKIRARSERKGNDK